VESFWCWSSFVLVENGFQRRLSVSNNASAVLLYDFIHARFDDSTFVRLGNGELGKLGGSCSS
jgi:hypothetical protein